MTQPTLKERIRRAVEFDEPNELQEWYDIGADIRINIRKQFSKTSKLIEAMADLVDAVTQLLARYEGAENREINASILKKDMTLGVHAVLLYRVDELNRVLDEMESGK